MELSEGDVQADLPRLVVDPAVPAGQPAVEADIIVTAAGRVRAAAQTVSRRFGGCSLQAACKTFGGMLIVP